MVGYILKRSLAVLAKKPIMLWGVSIMCSLITILIILAGFSVPIITIPVVLTLAAGMSALYLDGYNGKAISSKQLFKGFSKECVPRVTGGMCWYYLWLSIWAFVPVAGIVKSYSYRFTPYILITRPEIEATEALKLSMLETKGYKLMMFLTDLLITVAVFLILLLLTALSMIPYIGILFAIITALVSLAMQLFLPLFYGLVSAAFYQETKNGTFTAATYTPPAYNNNVYSNAAPYTDSQAPAAGQGDWYCTSCGTLNPAGTYYCRACGNQKEQ